MLSVEKALFGVRELDFTGFHVSGDGVTPMKSKCGGHAYDA
jgi:hypothetical protein